MPSMDSPFSSFFSISTISLTPSTTSCTCSTSEEPRRSALEMSKTPPTEAVSTPPRRERRSTYHCSITLWDFLMRGLSYLCRASAGAAWSGSPQTWGVC
uniref:Uncharacterized protein n=1 Tax=Oryzias sinensis TaxID=183150 RepID=A0A8C8DTI0_9TELE